MAEINVKITEINSAITKLQNLQSRCDSINTPPPSTVGGGQTVNELEDIADVYKALNRDFAELISNTISFLQNVKVSYMESDTKAAKYVGGGSSGGVGVSRNF